MSTQEFFVHDTALVATDRIGPGARIWAFCNVQEGAVIGADCNIGDHCFIEKNVILGDRVTVKNGVSLWEGVRLEDDVFIGPGAVFTNDIYPRSKVYDAPLARTLVREGATIGAGAIVIAGHTVGRYAFIGAGAVVTKDVPDFSLWYGNPARMVAYVCKCARRLDLVPRAGGEASTACRCECGREYRLQGDSLTLIE